MKLKTHCYKIINYFCDDCVVVLVVSMVLILFLNYTTDYEPTSKPLTIDWVNQEPFHITTSININNHYIIMTNDVSLSLRSDSVVIWKLTHNW